MEKATADDYSKYGMIPFFVSSFAFFLYLLKQLISPLTDLVCKTPLPTHESFLRNPLRSLGTHSFPELRRGGLTPLGVLLMELDPPIDLLGFEILVDHRCAVVTNGNTSGGWV